jgi:hypothetical protein
MQGNNLDVIYSYWCYILIRFYINLLGMELYIF